MRRSVKPTHGHPATPPNDSVIPDNLRIRRQIGLDLNLAFGLPFYADMGALKQSYREVFLSDDDAQSKPKLIVLGSDGRLYAVGTDVVIRPATPQEARKAIRREKQLRNLILKDEIEQLECSLSRAS